MKPATDMKEAAQLANNSDSLELSNNQEETTMINWQDFEKNVPPRFSQQLGDSPFGPFKIIFKKDTPDWGVEVTITPWGEQKKFPGGTLNKARQWCEDMLLEKIRQCLPEEPVGTVQSIIHVDWTEDKTHGVAYVNKDIPPGTDLFAAPVVETESAPGIEEIYHDALQNIIHAVWGTPNGSTGEQAAHWMHGKAERALQEAHEARAKHAEWIQAWKSIDEENGMGKPPKHPKMSMISAINHTCGELPAGISVTLDMENGAATYNAYDRDGDGIELPELVDYSLEDQLYEIVTYLKNWDQTAKGITQPDQMEPGSIVEDLESSIEELVNVKHAEVENLALHLLPSAYRENMAIARMQDATEDAEGMAPFLQYAISDSFDLADRFIARSQGLREEYLHDAEAKVKGAISIRNRE